MPIISRITVDGKIAQFSTKLEVNPDFWDLKSGKSSGRTRELQRINGLLDEIRAAIHRIYHEMLKMRMRPYICILYRAIISKSWEFVCFFNPQSVL